MGGPAAAPRHEHPRPPKPNPEFPEPFMLRPVIVCVCVTVWAAVGGTAFADQAAIAPTTYEVLINGESFRVEADRATTVQSARQPGTKYKLVVRIAQTQVLRLNKVRLEYDMPASVTDNRSHRQRTVEIKHQLGFSILLTDLGGPLEAAAVDKALQAQVDTLAETHGQEKATISKPIKGKFAVRPGAGQSGDVHRREREGPHLPGLRAERPEVQRRLRRPVPGRGQGRRFGEDQAGP